MSIRFSKFKKGNVIKVIFSNNDELKGVYLGDGILIVYNESTQQGQIVNTKVVGVTIKDVRATRLKAGLSNYLKVWYEQNTCGKDVVQYLEQELESKLKYLNTYNLHSPKGNAYKVSKITKYTPKGTDLGIRVWYEPDEDGGFYYSDEMPQGIVLGYFKRIGRGIDLGKYEDLKTKYKDFIRVDGGLLRADLTADGMYAITVEFILEFYNIQHLTKGVVDEFIKDIVDLDRHLLKTIG